jgi:hypothetical protein
MTTPWAGQIPNRCQICHRPFAQCRDRRNPESRGETFIDGRTVAGPWANMGEGCFVIHGVGLGLGKGQRWNWQTGERLPDPEPERDDPDPLSAEIINDLLDLDH